MHSITVWLLYIACGEGQLGDILVNYTFEFVYACPTCFDLIPQYAGN